MCDASGAVPLGPHVFAVADDEDNILRVYDAERGGPALYGKDVSAGLGLLPRPRKDPSRPPKPPAEADIEAATLVGDLAFWLTSHGTGKHGKPKPERLRLFATTRPDYGKELEVVGRAYTGLIADMASDPRFASLRLSEAAKLPPKEPGGLNIEGMTARREGGVYIGFRNPVPDGLALLVVLENPEEVIDGKPARLGVPVRLDLGGRGIRGLSEHRGRYLILAGASGPAPGTGLFAWDGHSQPTLVPADLGGLNPEGLFTPEGSARIMVLSDDGSVESDGRACKRLGDATKKGFRGRWVTLPAVP